jgi:hypothetical protein
VLTTAQHIWEALDTPLSLSCSILAKYQEFEQLVRKDINPSEYCDARTFQSDYQAVKLLSKFPNLPTGIDKTAAAQETFVAAEKSCLETNGLFRKRADGLVNFRPVVESVFFRMQRKVSRVLGRCPSLEQLDYRFGPGASYGVRRETTPYHKLQSQLECTQTMADILPEFLGEFPGWIDSERVDCTIRAGNQLSFVPKNAKTERSICIEPLLNGLMQKGIGTYLRGRLQNHGVDLDDQTVNQDLCKEALSRNLATIDFSSASDMISYLLVLELLPPEWFELLDCCRSPSFEFKGRWFPAQKFSSMGNAYTFELESLIFFALATSVCEEMDIQWSTGRDGNLGVYGDDVIIPSECYDLFVECSEAVGFRVSQEKSFKSGLFFESCGFDYFDGIFVRPFQIKRDLNNLLDAFYVHNTLTRLEKRYDEPTKVRLRTVRHRIVAVIPRGLRVMGPEGFGDGHLLADWDQVSPKAHPQYDTWVFNSYVEVGIPLPVENYPNAYALYCALDCGFSDGSSLDRTRVMPRGKTRIQRTRIFSGPDWVGPSGNTVSVSILPRRGTTWE